MITLITGYLLIFFSRVVDVSLATLRTLMIVRGRRLQAASIGFFEVIIYIIALKKVVSTLDNPVSLLAYALGFATGNYVGSFIEEKMAIGCITVQVIAKNDTGQLQEVLRNQGFGVTVIEGMGKKGKRNILNIILRRKDLPSLIENVKGIDEDAFIAVMDARTTYGGYIRNIRKGK